MFEKLKKRVTQEKQAIKSKTKEQWSLRHPKTGYEKYIESHRGFKSKKRGNAWFELSGGKDMRNDCGEEYYKKIVEYSNKDPNSKDNIQIEKDIPRTSLKGIPDFSEKELNNLREVLRAVSYELRLEGGYCQSMNFIAALLLLHMDNELAFYTQVCINRLLFTNYFTEDLFGVRVDERIFLSLLTERLPNLTDHLSECDVSLTHLTFHWFMCLFINVLPLEVTEYIWDRVFYFGAHVIHAAALALFSNNKIALCSLDDLEQIVLFLNEKLEEVTVNDFSGIESSGISLPRIRILRSDVMKELKKEEQEVKKRVASTITQSLSRQKSMRMSFSSAVVEDVKQSPEVLCSYKMILRMKNEIVLYLIKHCAESYGIPAEQVSSRKLRDYCYAGFSKDEFLSLWNVLYRLGVIAQQDPQAHVETFRQYERMRKGEQIVDIREVLTGLLFTLTEKVDIQTRLQYFFSVYDMKNEGVISKQAFTDFISAVYEDCKVEDVERAAEKYVKIVFAVNTQSPTMMSFQEFRSLVVIQPQIINYLQLIDVSEDESISSPEEDLEKSESETPIIDVKNLPDYLANHPFVQNACKWPEKEQRALNGFLQDIAYLIKDRDNLRMSGLNSSFQNSYKKSIRLSSNRLLGTSMPMRHMDSICEEDEITETVNERPSISTMQVTVRRRS